MARASKALRAGCTVQGRAKGSRNVGGYEAQQQHVKAMAVTSHWSRRPRSSAEARAKRSADSCSYWRPVLKTGDDAVSDQDGDCSSEADSSGESLGDEEPQRQPQEATKVHDEHSRSAGLDASMAVPPGTPEPLSAVPKSVEVTDELIFQGVVVALTNVASLAASQQDERLTCFHCKFPPSVTICDYLMRIKRFFNCSAECYVAGLIYIDRLLKLRPHVVFSPMSCHRLICVSMVAAAKYHEDRFYSNKFYAKIGGLPLQELNALEIRFLQLLDWKLNVQQHEYAMYLQIVCQAGAQSSH